MSWSMRDEGLPADSAAAQSPPRQNIERIDVGWQQQIATQGVTGIEAGYMYHAAIRIVFIDGQLSCKNHVQGSAGIHEMMDDLPFR